ncbi:MAG: transposase [Syntrophomonadaceae bacterium]
MLKSLLLFFLNSFKSKSQLRLENINLRKQIEILQRTNPKLQIKRSDRLVFSLMKDFLTNWKDKVFIVKPETVIKWHRSAFRSYWKRKSRHNGGRPKIDREVIDLIRQIANDNPLWGVPRIHGELKKLGFNISQSTVQRYMPKRNGRTTGQRWKTFLRNHSKEIISIDFLTVPTINFKLVHVFVVIEHHRRKIIHVNVTKNPTAEWTLQQIRNLLFSFDTPKYLIRDRDSRYGNVFTTGVKNLGIKQIVTSYRSPWQNGYVERVIGSIKRECLDHVIILNEDHLKSVLSTYLSYYNKQRTHLGINKDSPDGRPVQTAGKIEKIPAVNGLHHVYYRQAA